MNHLLHNCLKKPPYGTGGGRHHIKTTWVLVGNVENNPLEVLIFDFLGNGLNLFFTPKR